MLNLRRKEVDYIVPRCCAGLAKVERCEAFSVLLFEEVVPTTNHEPPEDLHHAILSRDVQTRVAVRVTSHDVCSLYSNKLGTYCYNFIQKLNCCG